MRCTHLFLCCLYVLISGCAAPRPESLRETERDKAVYVDAGAPAQLAQNNAECVVLALDAGSAWVEVFDFKVANVKRGHYVSTVEGA